MGSPAGISSSTVAAASIFASRSSSTRRSPSSAGRTTRRPSTTTSASRIGGCCAGTTSSRSPSSASSEDERPGLAVERSIAAAAVEGADGLGLALARIVDIADRLLDESKDWLWIGGRMPDPGDRVGRHVALLERFEARLREAVPADEVPGVRPPRTPTLPVRARRRARRGARAAPSCPRSGRPAGCPGRPSRPDHHDRRALRRPARRTTRPGHPRPDPDQPPQGHEDQALLLRRGVPGRPARHVRLQADLGRRRHARGAGQQEDQDLHAPAAGPRQAAVQRQDRQVPPDLRPQGPGWGPDPRPAHRRLARVVPGLGVRHGRHAGQLGQRRLPDGLRRQGRGRRHPGAHGRRRGPDGLPVRAPGRARSTSSPTSWPIARAHTSTTTVATTVADEPVRVTVRSWPDDPPWAERVSGLLDDRAARPRRAHRPGLAARRRRSSSRRPWRARPVATPACSTRRQGKVEIAYYADDFVVLHEAAHGWFNGALLADRWANEAFASYYATERRHRPGGRGPRTPS